MNADVDAVVAEQQEKIESQRPKPLRASADAALAKARQRRDGEQSYSERRFTQTGDAETEVEAGIAQDVPDGEPLVSVGDGDEKGTPLPPAAKSAAGKRRRAEEAKLRDQWRTGEARARNFRMPEPLSEAFDAWIAECGLSVSHVLSLLIEDLLVGDRDETVERVGEYGRAYQLARAQYRYDQASS